MSQSSEHIREQASELASKQAPEPASELEPEPASELEPEPEQTPSFSALAATGLRRDAWLREGWQPPACHTFYASQNEADEVLACDVVIAGCGVAGLYAALNLPRDMNIVLLSKTTVEECDSMLAQGGICVMRDEHDYASFYEDTMRAGHYENRAESVDIMIRSSRSVIDDLVRLGVNFERDETGALAYTREGADSRARICFHADITGQEITTTLLQVVRTLPNVHILEHVEVVDILEGKPGGDNFGAICGIAGKNTGAQSQTRSIADEASDAQNGTSGITNEEIDTQDKTNGISNKDAGVQGEQVYCQGVVCLDRRGVSSMSGTEQAPASVEQTPASAEQASISTTEQASASVADQSSMPITEQAFVSAASQDSTSAIKQNETSGAKKLVIRAPYTILATGGIGGLYTRSTNFPSLTGDACRIVRDHGIELEHMDYVQIHPTSLYTTKPGRAFLISESCRGEGAVLLDAQGNRFVDELQPRDVVSAAIFDQMAKDGTDHVMLSFAPLDQQEILTHFANIYERCLEEGYDLLREPIPVVPAQHYFMGGIHVDSNSQTSLAHLFAVGETSCNGVHGKNRLASNSLLESLVFAQRAARYIAADVASSVAAGTVADVASSVAADTVADVVSGIAADVAVDVCCESVLS